MLYYYETYFILFYGPFYDFYQPYINVVSLNSFLRICLSFWEYFVRKYYMILKTKLNYLVQFKLKINEVFTCNKSYFFIGVFL